ncbi:MULTISPECIES: ATP-binding protein [unclassified Synechococcus]|uniref:ATP-binding protein n=1 Tax=unclassified Synechococcus TaxID=2626047 RepID=UPI002001B045|nr:ATP-binding protein [Synechococcus sp. A10-1-5-1]UPM50446.1 ATP-binding protein [Synechococcus sp. A10-1-5-1]
MALRWADYITPSTLHLAPLLELLLEPIQSAEQLASLQLGLQEVLVNAVRHGNGNDPLKCVRVRRILTPRWCVFQVQDEGPGVPPAARQSMLPDQLDAVTGRGFFLIHQCFEDVRWSHRGNRVQVAIRRA